MKTVTIPAAVNGKDGIYTERMDRAGFSIISATSSFFIQIRQGERQKISAGQPIGLSMGPPLGRVTLSNPSSTSIDVIIGEYGSVVSKIPADLENVLPITQITNPFTYDFWDTTGGGAAPETTPLVIPANKPFRRIWAFYEATTFPADNAVTLDFTLDGTLVLSLIARLKSSTGPSEWGMGMNATVDQAGTRIPTANDFFFRNSIGATYFQIHPFDTYIVADTVTANRTSGVAGTIRAWLGVMSTEVKI